MKCGNCWKVYSIQAVFTKLASPSGYTIDKDVSNLSAEIMEETLLNAQQLRFDFLTDEKIMKSIQLGKIDLVHLR